MTSFLEWLARRHCLTSFKLIQEDISADKNSEAIKRGAKSVRGRIKAKEVIAKYSNRVWNKEYMLKRRRLSWE